MTETPLTDAVSSKKSPLSSAHAFAIVAIIAALASLAYSPLAMLGVIFAIVGVALAATEWKRMRAPVAAMILSVVAMCVACGGFSLNIVGSMLNKMATDARRAATSARLADVHAGLRQYAQVNLDWYPVGDDGLSLLAKSGITAPDQLVSLATDGSSTRPYLYAAPAKPVSEHMRPENVIVVYEDPRIVSRPAALHMDGRIVFMKYLDLRNALLAQKSPPPPHSPGMR